MLKIMYMNLLNCCNSFIFVLVISVWNFRVLTAIYVTINVYLMGNEQITSNGYNLSIYFPNALHQNNYIIKHINIYTLNWLSGASSMFESPSQQAPDSRNRRRDRSVCTGRYANNTVEVQLVSYALPNCPGPAKWEKHHKTTFLS